MRFPSQWLQQILSVQLPTEQIAKQLTSLGLEVESLENDWIELAVAPNRGDCLGLYGVARELAAALQIALPKPELPCQPPIVANSFAWPLTLSANEACPRYCAQVIRGLSQQLSSPKWLLERLLGANIHPIHPIVDVTNYVMLMWGQPMHAYDVRHIQGTVEIRYAKDKEPFETLQHTKLCLSSADVVITDNNKVLALAGIVGGQASAIQTDTHDILLEAAYFSPVTIRKSAKRHKLSTDASYRFERGVDPSMPSQAIAHAIALLVELQAQQTNSPLLIEPLGTVESLTDLPVRPTIGLRLSEIHHLLGHSINQQQVLEILERLSCQVVRDGSDTWQVYCPSHRQDLQGEADLIEEIARFTGYDNIPAKPLTGLLSPFATDNPPHTDNKLVDILTTLGYSQNICYSFITSKHAELFADQKELWHLENPISADLAVMRPSLLPGLLKSLSYNIHRQQTQLKLFECGLCFTGQGQQLQQTKQLAALAYGTHQPIHWSKTHRPLDFFDLKGVVESIWQQLGHHGPLQYRPSQHPCLNSGIAANIYANDKLLGFIGQLHGAMLAPFDLPDQAVVLMFECLVEPLLSPPHAIYQPISKFPGIKRDFAFLLADNHSAGQLHSDIVSYLKKQDDELLIQVTLFDVYRGEHVPLGQKSMAVSLLLQHPNHTLTEQTVTPWLTTLIKELANQGITLRY